MKPFEQPHTIYGILARQQTSSAVPPSNLTPRWLSCHLTPHPPPSFVPLLVILVLPSACSPLHRSSEYHALVPCSWLGLNLAVRKTGPSVPPLSHISSHTFCPVKEGSCYLFRKTGCLVRSPAMVYDHDRSNHNRVVICVFVCDVYVRNMLIHSKRKLFTPPCEHVSRILFTQ
jgi:hypothetical protein